LICDKLRLHRHVTKLPAKHNRLGVLVCPIAAKCAHEQKDEDKSKKSEQLSSATGIIQVQNRIPGNAAPLATSPLEEPPAEECNQPQHHECRENDPGEDTYVRTLV